MTPRTPAILASGLAAAAGWVLPVAARATPTSDQVLQSIGDYVGPDVNGLQLGLVLGLLLAVIVTLALLQTRRRREVRTPSLHHAGKLHRELARALHLSPVEARQLRRLADLAQVEHPTTLLLCPTLLARLVREHAARIDRQVVSDLVRRIVR